MTSFAVNLRPAAKAGWIVPAASLHLRNPAKGQSEVFQLVPKFRFS
jgi:hypothetical protein